MNRLVLLAGLLGWVGATLVLSGWRRFSRPSLTERLRPFVAGASSAEERQSALSVDSLAGVLRPMLAGFGDRLSSLFGVTESTDARLRRIHSPVSAAEFRVRQFAWSGAGLAFGLLAAAGGLPLPAVILGLVGGPLLGFLVVEQRLSAASRNWQESLRRELPVIGEQLAMLLNAGYSLGAALTRLAERGQGCAARDLGLVVNRVRQGLSESQALREWADRAGVEALDRLVGILALNSEAGDLGRLVGNETRQARRDLQRVTAAAIERRDQQVWIPVTVATLIPGAILLAIPFLAALRLFSST
ncbi:MAG: type II secretion system F family protein [Acidimicrobiaceae bacterium]|nr:type II secretion system F family protein [Acidimicrobiaceae bacterium]MBO0746835.1 type II secretion system F family protein [Acidimicrobiaceae bacterium]